MRLSKKLVTSFAIVGAMAVLAPGTAHAAPGAAAVAVVGQGGISPGLSLTPTFQSVSFTGTAAGAAVGLGPATVADAGAVNCSFSGGSSAPETSLAGTGTVTGGCSGTGLVLGVTVTVSCGLTYDRTGPLVTVTGNCTVSGGGATVNTSTTAGVFLFVPTTAQPTTSYLLAGAAAGVGVN